MKLLIFILLLNVNCLYGQELVQSTWNNLCTYHTDKEKNYLGIKLKLKVPCDWEQREGVRPNSVLFFSYDIDSTSIFTGVTIKRISFSPTKQEIEKATSAEGLKKIYAANGEFISGRKVQIDGINVGEAIIKLSTLHPVDTSYSYQMHYNLYYKDKMIDIGYSVSSTNEMKAKNIFYDNLIQFRKLAGSTVLMNQWE